MSIEERDFKLSRLSPKRKSTQINVSMLLLILLGFLGVILTVVSFNAIDASVRRVSEDSLPAAADAAALAEHAAALAGAGPALAAAATAAELERAYAGAAEQHGLLLASLEKLDVESAAAPPIAEHAGALLDNLAELRARQAELLRIAQDRATAGGPATPSARETQLLADRSRLLAVNRERAQALTLAAAALRADAHAAAAAGLTEAAGAIAAGRIRLLVLGIASTALLLLVTYLLIRVGIRSVALEFWIRRMGAGDLDYKVEPTGQDEITELAIALEELRLRSIKAMQLDIARKLAADLKAKNDELERVLAELRQAQDQILVRQKLAELGELTAGVAHEIRNPLNFMQNFSEASEELLAELKESLADSAGELDDDTRALIDEISQDLADNLDRIKVHGERANRIVRDMLMLGRGGGSAQAVDINELLSDRAKLAYHSTRAQDPDFTLEIREEFDPDAGKILAAPDNLGRVFLNMVGNACYATAEKNRALREQGEAQYLPTVWLRTERKEDELEIRIRDNGVGVSPETLAKMFNPFFTTKPTDKGTGLGLSISSDIIREHGGAITPDSVAGEYMEMKITLPA